MYTENTYTIPINSRGGLTLPQKLREEAGVNAEDMVVAEITGKGILLRPATVVPVKIFTDKEIDEFKKEDKELGRLLDELGVEKEDFPR